MATKKQTGLGKGFEALIPGDFDSSLLVEEQDRIQKVLVTSISAGKQQPRSTFNEQLLQELASSIGQHGVLQPLIVRSDGSGNYTIVAGERRWRAAKMAGLTQVPVIVRSMEELEELELALVENVQRVDLSPLEQAISIQRLRDQFSLSPADIAKKLGKAQSTVINIERLLKLPVKAREALRDGLISEGHARTILALNGDESKQLELLDFIIKNGWTVRQAEQFVVAAKKGAPTTGEAKKKADSTTPETEKLSKRIGRSVSIRRLAKGGKLEIGFKTDEELDVLLQAMNDLKKL